MILLFSGTYIVSLTSYLCNDIARDFAERCSKWIFHSQNMKIKEELLSKYSNTYSFFIGDKW